MIGPSWDRHESTYWSLRDEYPYEVLHVNCSRCPLDLLVREETSPEDVIRGWGLHWVYP